MALLSPLSLSSFSHLHKSIYVYTIPDSLSSMGKNKGMQTLIQHFTTFSFMLLFLVEVLHAKHLPLRILKNVPPALFAFGDSIVDPGNNNRRALSIAKCNFPPYGRDFIHHQATGRFSNGRIPTDMLVSAFGIKELLPAYFDPDLKPSDLLTGVSFASGGAGYDPSTSNLQTALRLEVQLKLFRDCKVKMEKIAGHERTKSIVSESIYIIVMGTNDIGAKFITGRLLLDQSEVSYYAKSLVRRAFKFILKLYELGAKQFWISGLPPVGCVPFIRTVLGGVDRQCQEDLNQAAVLFNSELQGKIKKFNARYADLEVQYIDIYNNLLHIINHPHGYGFEVGDRGCCGTGLFESAFLCNQFETTCWNASNYVFWDSFHPTERTYQILMDKTLHEFGY